MKANVAPKVAKYRCIPANKTEEAMLELAGLSDFSAWSVGDDKKQYAIIPCDSSEEKYAHMFAECVNVCSETGKTPRQLAEENVKLWEINKSREDSSKGMSEKIANLSSAILEIEAEIMVNGFEPLRILNICKKVFDVRH